MCVCVCVCMYVCVCVCVYVYIYIYSIAFNVLYTCLKTRGELGHNYVLYLELFLWMLPVVFVFDQLCNAWF